MKKILLIIFLLINSISFSQNLSLSELFSICNKQNWDEASEFLMKKGWEYHESTKGDNEHYSTITWSFNKDSYSNKAQGWFYLYTYEGLPNKIAYSFFNKTSYTGIKSGITAAGMKLIDNSIEDNELVAKYSGGSFIVSVRTAKRESEERYSSENSITAYAVVVIKKSGVFDSDNGKKTDYYDKESKNEQIKKAEYYLTNGKINGQLKLYHENGKLKKVGNYINGKENGKFIEYDEQGMKSAEYTMENGEINGIVTTYENGLKSEEISESKGVKTGKYIAYYYDENKLYLKITGNYLQDEKNGLWQHFRIIDGKEELVAFTNYSGGVKHGSFKEYVHSDTIETGTYKYDSNGNKEEILDGYFTRKTKLKSVDGDFIGWILNCEGNYDNGVKTGKWIYYSIGHKSEEGNYEDGKKKGKWFDYIIYPSHYGEIQIETNYKNDLENGLQKLNFWEVHIDDSVDGKYSGYKIKNVPIQMLCNLKNGIKDGEFVFKDSTGELIEKGNYSNDKKNGLWIEHNKSDIFHSENSILEKGNYSDGNRNGIWEEYMDTEFPIFPQAQQNIPDEKSVLIKKNYVDGKLNGKTIQYNSNHKLSEEIYFEWGELRTLNIYDSLGVSIIKSYELLSEPNNVFKCRKTEINDSGKISQIYLLTKAVPETEWLPPPNAVAVTSKEKDSFVEDPPSKGFVVPASDLPSFDDLDFDIICPDGCSLGYPDGEYKVYDKNNNILVEGSLYKKSKTGNWKYYYRDINILKKQEFKDDVGGIEKYFSLNTDQEFSGKFIQKYSNGKSKFEFKISEGFRDGKSKYFDENGNQIKTEKYEKGVLMR